jgi:diguanylate cyclase (GGDEF)-like protein
MSTPQIGRSRVGKRQRRFAWVILSAILVLGVLAMPVASRSTGVIPGFFPMFQASMFLINLILAVLLLIKGQIEERGDSVRLGAAYLYIALIVVPLTASFPGGFLPEPMIGTAETGLWLWCFWHDGFGLAILRYAWFASRRSPQSSSLWQSVALVFTLVVAATLISAGLIDQLPSLLDKGQFRFSGPVVLLPGSVVVITAAAFLGVASLRAKTPEQLWLLVGMTAACVEVWLTLHGTARFSLGWYLAKAESLLVSLAVLISLLHDITWLYSDAAAKNAALQTLARNDGLMGIANRRRFDELIDEEIRWARRQETPLALVMLDIDWFKRFNDAYGHTGGDECLRRVAAAVQGALLRPGDQVARYGGEELAILLPATDLAGGIVIADRVRKAVAALAITHSGSDFGIVTISAGVGSFLPLRGDETAEDLVNKADRALYRSKKDGRNRVCAETDATTSPPAVPARIRPAGADMPT